MIGIDLFAGVGGMSLGAKYSEIKVISAIENDLWAAQTHSFNFKETEVFCEDIRKISGSDLFNGKRSEPLIIFGGPPCKGFSTSNQKTRTLNNPSNWLFTEYIRIIREIRPDWVVFENVKGILETEQGIFLNHVIEELRAANYKLDYKVLNAVDFGVPQTRSRLFIIGTLDKTCEISFPEPTVSRPVTVSEAIFDLPVLSVGANINELSYKCDPISHYAKQLRGELTKSTNHLVTRNAPSVVERYKHIPQAGNWENIPENLMKNYKDRSRCHTGIYYRLKETAPSVVIGNYRKNMLIHPTEDRGLSVREAARLQSFPDWFEFKGSIGFQQQQVGNAVPPLLAKAVFDSIKNSLKM
jgi:DNA (cytosine-5)-methyltransferase 1